MGQLKYYTEENGKHKISTKGFAEYSFLWIGIGLVLLAFFLDIGRTSKIVLIFCGLFCFFAYYKRLKSYFIVETKTRTVAFKDFFWKPENKYSFQDFSRFHVHSVTYFGFIPVNAIGSIFFQKGNEKELGYTLKVTFGATKSIQKMIDETAMLLEIPENKM